MQKQPELIGLEAMPGRAIRFQGAFVILDLIFCLAASTVNLSVKHLGAGVLHVRHDKAGVDALVRYLDLAHHAARARPRPGLETCRVEAGDLAPITRIGPLGLLDHLPSQRRQDAIAGQTGYITEGRLLLDPPRTPEEPRRSGRGGKGVAPAGPQRSHPGAWKPRPSGRGGRPPLMSERVKAGMAAAKARGKRFGRPATPPHVVSRIEALAHTTSMSIRQIHSA